MWVFRKSDGCSNSWEVGYYVLGWKVIHDLPIQPSGFKVQYSGLTRGEAADKVHYLNGGNR